MEKISRLFKNLFSGKESPEKTVVGPLDDLVKKTKDPVVETQIIVPETSAPQQEVVIEEIPPKPLYGEALRKHMGWPDWFYDSQAELVRFGIRGEAQIEGARSHTPEQIRNIYARLSTLLKFDTPSFVRLVPQIFSYRNHYLDSYLQKLAALITLVGEKFEYKLPPELDWRRDPSIYFSIHSLEELEKRLADKVGAKPQKSELAEALAPYAGKRILLLGVRTEHQEATLRKHLSTSAKLTFHRGEDIRGLVGQYLNFDVIVVTGGVATHSINALLKSQLGGDIYTKKVDAYDSVNPERVLTVMAENAYKFKGR